MKIKLVLFFLLTLSLGFHVPSDAYANDGSSITEVESLEHNTDRGRENSLVQVDSDTYALAYAELVYDGAGRDGHISTFTISVTVTSSGETKKGWFKMS